jgi:hypothetical protein
MGRPVPDEPVVTRTDPVVDRVNELVTTALDVSGVVLFALAAWYLGASLSSPGTGFALSSMVLLAASGIVQRRARPRKPASKPARVAPPGPADPGNLHVKGR